MKLTLASHPICPFVHRAAAMLHHKGVAFELRPVDLEAKPDWFLAISPRGKVPVLVVDDIPLFESAAIVEFLDETHPPRVIPDDPIERARQRAWIEVANDLLAAQHKLIAAPTDAELAAARPALDAVLARFETAVRGTWFAGDAIGIVDFAVAPIAYRFGLYQRLGVQLLTDLPRVDAWMQRLAALPAVIRALPADFDARYLAFVKKRGGLLAASLTA